MICPACRKGMLVRNPDGAMYCGVCHLRRKPLDRVLVREETQFHVLNRNLDRSPPGTMVEIVGASPGLRGMYGQFKDAPPVLALRSEHGFIISTSLDQDDFVLLIVERDWQIADPKVRELVEVLNDNH